MLGGFEKSGFPVNPGNGILAPRAPSLGSALHGFPPLRAGYNPIYPKTQSNLVHWWRADSLLPRYGDGEPVTLWKDSHGTNDASNLVAASTPKFRKGVLNGMPAVRFDGVDDILNVTLFGLTNGNACCFVVWQFSTAASAGMIFGRVGNVFQWFARSDDTISMFDGGIQFQSSAFKTPHTGARLGIWKWGGDAGGYQFLENNFARGNAGGGGTNASFDVMGCRNGTDNFIGADIAEIVVFDAQKTNQFCLDMFNNYFKPKYLLPTLTV